MDHLHHQKLAYAVTLLPCKYSSLQKKQQKLRIEYGMLKLTLPTKTERESASSLLACVADAFAGSVCTRENR